MGFRLTNHAAVVEEYTPPEATLNGEPAVVAFARSVRRHVIRDGGQGDCVDVCAAMSAILDDLNVAHIHVRRTEGTYLDGTDPVPHAWIRVSAGELPLFANDVIIDPTAEQFMERNSDVHVLDVEDAFVQSHYQSGRLSR